MMIRKGYSDGPEGQVHWRICEPETSARQPDLYCFAPAPFSSISYTSIMPHLAKGRRVIAPDYPGQGGSGGGSPTSTIAEFARSMLAVIDDLSGDAAVDVLGFHSGCLVAAETSLQAPRRVGRIVLIDAPAFDAETRAKYLPVIGAPFDLSPDIDSLAKPWDMAVTKRSETQPLGRSLAMFADIVGNGPRMNATFHAAFTYDVEARLSKVAHPVFLLATQSGLLEPTRRAAGMIAGAVLKERLDITRSVLDEAAAETAAEFCDFLA